jgi:hypothetical protein
MLICCNEYHCHVWKWKQVNNGFKFILCFILNLFIKYNAKNIIRGSLIHYLKKSFSNSDMTYVGCVIASANYGIFISKTTNYFVVG